MNWGCIAGGVAGFVIALAVLLLGWPTTVVAANIWSGGIVLAGSAIGGVALIIADTRRG